MVDSCYAITGIYFCHLLSFQYSNVTVFAKYTGSVFRAMSHMLSIGYGNLGPPVNVADTWVTMISMLAGATFYALFIGHMSSLLMTLDSSGRLYNEKVSVTGQALV